MEKRADKLAEKSAEFQSQWTQSAVQQRASKPMPDDAKVFADFRGGDLARWCVDGAGLAPASSGGSLSSLAASTRRGFESSSKIFRVTPSSSR